ncbi:MAG: hypothetical protein EBZ77_03415 [Chitinophagia bacterium]|nr:hypothetical protein [Chitinophagia bacterium]
MIHLKDLGAVPVFVVNTTNVDTSVAYYSLLGFTELMRADWPFRWVLISDGAVQIMLRQGEVPYLSLTYFGGDLSSFVHEREAGGVVFT